MKNPRPHYSHSEQFLTKKAARDEKILALYQEGHTTNAVAMKLGLSWATVKSVVLRAEESTHPRRSAKKPQVDVDVSSSISRLLKKYPNIDQYIGEEPLTTTADRYDISRERVRQIAVEMGVTKRSGRAHLWKKILPDVDSSLSIKDDAERLGVSTATVAQARKALNPDHDGGKEAWLRQKQQYRDEYIRLLAAVMSPDEGDLTFSDFGRKMGWVDADGRVVNGVGVRLKRYIKYGLIERPTYGTYRLTPTARSLIASSRGQASPSSGLPRSGDGTPPRA